MAAQDDLHTLHPFTELFPALQHVLDAGFDAEEVRTMVDDIVWMCEREADRLENPLDAVVQELLGLVAGIASDGVLCDAEVRHLRHWLDEQEHLQTIFPYDEIRAMFTAGLRDGVLDAGERAELLAFFGQFSRVGDHRAVDPVALAASPTLVGVCAVQPEVTFDGKVFCFTGAFRRHARAALERVVSGLGGRSVTAVSERVHYLVVGAGGNPCWAHACYGRKVEAAVHLRRGGARLQLVHENDFLDAVLDAEGGELLARA